MLSFKKSNNYND